MEKKPMNKPRKDLSIMQKRLMKEHSKYHSKEHLSEMRKQMKAGYCFEQSHAIAKKKYKK